MTSFPLMARAALLAAGLALAAEARATADAGPSSDAAHSPSATASPPVASAVPLVTGPRARPVASYTLRARLDAARHRVSGEGTLTWVNSSSAPVEELYFHLYLNAFEHAQTLFNRSPFARARSGRAPERWGSIRLTRLVARELGDADLLPLLEPHSPGDPLDGTDRRLPLPAPVAPGATLTLELAWDSTLPSIVERTGESRGFYFVAQWFPKLARLEADGTWAHFMFHPHAEFYADYGDYDVTLDVPADMIVGATGRRLAEASDAGRRVLRQRAESVHDFAWTAWAGFERREERVGPVDVHLLHPRGHARNAEQTLRALRYALPHFGERYGAYPYPDLTVVHPPSHAAPAGGMEYPMLITTGGPWHQPYWSRAVEIVTIHELGHQWFYGLLGTHEPRWPFLDEGLTSYAETLALEGLFGAGSAADVGGLELSATALHRALQRLAPEDAPIARPASEFVDMNELGALVYSRTAVLLRTLGNVYGPERLAEALRRYATRFRFGHPRPEDLLRELEGALGAGAAENARAALFEGASVNYSLRDLWSVRRRPSSSIGADAGAGGAPGGPGEALAESRVIVHRAGELRLPVKVALVTSSGQRLIHEWDGQGRDHVITHVGRDPIVLAHVDPDVAVLIDDELLDNSRRQERPPPLALWERALHWLSLLLAGATP